MIFQETPIFTKLIKELMDDELYRQLQNHLIDHPDAGDLIEGTGGLRKVRWKTPGSGKRGGVRVIYYWRVAEAQFLMLLSYAKSTTTDLTPAQKKQLRAIVEKW
ncbi:MAG TPA: type II toxin-antitoxin system RelE/ParE family toxin [Solimonas sp.]